MIFTVTLNPTLDKTLSVPQLEPGAVHRARLLRQDLGGKGINVSRALRALGIPSRLLGFLGGATGEAMCRGLLAGGFAADFIEVPGETRQNLTLLDEATGVYTKINEPGPTAGEVQVAALLAQIGAVAQAGDLWAFSGSLPPGAPPDLYAGLVRLAQARGGRAFLDTSGPAFAAGLEARPYAIKPNTEEAAELLGREIAGEEQHLAAARRLQESGPRLVCLSRGARGLVLAMDAALVVAEPPAVDARSPIGAGDSALAGLLWAVSEGCGAAETARRAVACGTAAAMQEGTGVGDRRLVHQLLDQVQIRQIA